MTMIGIREEVERELQTPWEPYDIQLIASRELTESGTPPPPGSAVTHVTQTLMNVFQTPERLRDVADRVETQKPDEDSLTLTQLLRKIAAALET
jgi:hypothetical protein